MDLTQILMNLLKLKSILDWILKKLILWVKRSK